MIVAGSHCLFHVIIHREERIEMKSKYFEFVLDSNAVSTDEERLGPIEFLQAGASSKHHCFRLTRVELKSVRKKPVSQSANANRKATVTDLGRWIALPCIAEYHQRTGDAWSRTDPRFSTEGRRRPKTGGARARSPEELPNRKSRRLTYSLLWRHNKPGRLGTNEARRMPCRQYRSPIPASEGVDRYRWCRRLRRCRGRWGRCRNPTPLCAVVV